MVLSPCRSGTLSWMSWGETIIYIYRYSIWAIFNHCEETLLFTAISSLKCILKKKRERAHRVTVKAAGESFYLSSLHLRGTHMGRLSGVTANTLKGNHVGEPIHKTTSYHLSPPWLLVQNWSPQPQDRSVFGSLKPPKIPRRLLISRPMCMISPRPSGVEGLMLNAAGSSVPCKCCLHPFP